MAQNKESSRRKPQNFLKNIARSGSKKASLLRGPEILKKLSTLLAEGKTG
jgi:hypothetical protein